MFDPKTPIDLKPEADMVPYDEPEPATPNVYGMTSRLVS